MTLSLLIWIDKRVLCHRWRWFCDAVWDWQMERDVANGKLDRLMESD